MTRPVQLDTPADADLQVPAGNRQTLRPQFERPEFSHSRQIAPRRQLAQEELTKVEERMQADIAELTSMAEKTAEH